MGKMDFEMGFNEQYSNQSASERQKGIISTDQKVFFLKFILPIFKYMEPSVKNLLFARKRQVVS